MKINQISPWINKDEEIALTKIIKKKFLTESSETKNFEKKCEKYFRAKNVVSYSNWTAGLFACLKVLNLKSGSEVIVPNLTFVATINSVILANLKPVLCDIDENNLCIDLRKMEKLITSKTKAIIPVHLYGNTCNLTNLKKICKQKKIYLIEDAAQSIGGKYKNRYLGTFGDFGGFSLYGNKIITTGEGSIIFTKKKSDLKKLYSFKNHGRLKKGVFKHSSIGFNFMFTEMQAALGNSQLKKLNKILLKKNKILNYYKNKLNKIKEIKFEKINKNLTKVNWFTNIFVKKEIKKKLQNYLSSRGIQTRDAFYPINKQPCFYKKKIIKNLNAQFPNSQKIYQTLISLPSSYELSSNELNYITNEIIKFFNKKK